MSRNNAKSKAPGFNAMSRSVRSTRTRSALPDHAKKSNSAVSSRTYSRMNNGGSARSGACFEVANGTISGNDSSFQYDESFIELEELRNEKELLDRMLDQQRQLQELKERQKRVLLLQQQLANAEASAEESLEDKLDKLQTAKQRLDELQQLVSTIKSAEMTGKGDGDRPQSNMPEKATRVRKALQELNELKGMINIMSARSGEKENTHKKPAATLEPVFPNAVEEIVSENQNRYEDDYVPVLPEVSVIQPRMMEDSPVQSSMKSPKRRSKDLSHLSVNAHLPYYKPNQASSSKKKNKTAVVKSPDEEPEDIEGTLRLLEEMQRHQKLLHELKERRQELEMLMNMTNGSDREQVQQNPEDDYDDANASVVSNTGSNDENRFQSDGEANDSQANQSGRLFGLSEVDTRRVIDLIRNQNAAGLTTTDKTTATWGSSTSGGDDEEDQTDAVPDSSTLTKEVVPKSHNSTAATSVKDAFTQLNRNNEHEIDFRPPTRRRRNITQSDVRKRCYAANVGGIDINKVQEDLHASNSAMHILLEDQQALSKLLLNTLALQQSSVSSKLCYGISPDFLIYQLDNCSTQFASMLKEMKDLQWQLYGITTGKDVIDNMEGVPTPRNPLATLPYVLNQQNVSYMDPSGADSFQLQIPSPLNDTQDQSMSLLNDSSQMRPALARNGYGKAEKDVEDGEADLFEALRDSIYSEAAILISQNESRPHFLVELFHTLQQLNTDYLRQHALYVLQDVVKGYLSHSPKKVDDPQTPKQRIRSKASFSENTPSENGVSSEDEIYGDMKQKVPDAARYDLALRVSSASELSSPSGDDSPPFAADDLGSTVIHLDAALRHMREVERLKQELKSSNGAVASPGRSKNVEIPSVNTKVLRVWIKNIVSEIIPLLKSSHDRMVDKKLVKKMHKKVFQCVSKDMAVGNSGENVDSDRVGVGEFFASQLKSILDDCLSKFLGQRVGSCGEDIIVGLSEVLFNELAFFYMMQDMGKANRTSSNGSSISAAAENSAQNANVEESDPSGGASIKDDEKTEDSEVSNADDGGVAVEESGVKNASSHASPDPLTYDLSVSETKPLTSYGSGEDEEDGSGEDYDYKEPEVCTSMQQNSNNTVKTDGDPPGGETCDAKSENTESDK